MILGGALGGFGSAMSSWCSCPDCLRVTTNKLDILGDGSCIACYPLDGDVTDLSGNYDGTWSKDEAYSSGKFGQAGQFSGNNIGIDTISLDDFTISGWVKFSDADEVCWLLSNGDGGDSLTDVMIKEDGTGRIDTVSDGGDNNFNFNKSFGTTSYNHFTFIREGGVGRVYLNGTNFISGITDYINEDSFELKQICRGDFSGTLDQVRIFNKSLTADEVYYIYTKENEAPKLPTTDGLVAHYPLTGTAEDTTGNYNGTENSNTYELQSDGSVAAVFTDDTDIDSNYKIELKDTDFSMSIWLKKITGDTEYYIGTSIWGASDRVDDSNGVGWNFMINSDNFVKILHSNGNDAYNTDIGTVEIPNDGNFYHVYLSYTHSDNKTVVIINNGDSETLTVNQDITKDTSRSFHIGSNSVDTDGKSKIRDVRFYNRALTQEEIANIYLYEKNHKDIPVTNGLIAYYPLHNNSLDNYYNQYDGTDSDNVSYDGNKATLPDGDKISFPDADGFVEAYYNQDGIVKTTTTESDLNDLTNCDLKDVRKYNRSITEQEQADIGYTA